MEQTSKTMSPEDLKRLFPHASAGTIAANSSEIPNRSVDPQSPATSKAEFDSEKKLQRAIADFLRSQDIWFFNARMDRRTGNTLGTPDFLFVVNGCPVALEVKMSGAVQTKEQTAAMDLMSKNGWRVAVVRSLQEAIWVVTREQGNEASRCPR